MENNLDLVSNTEVIPSGKLTFEEHVDRIRQALENLKYSIFEVADAIHLAYEQLDGDVFQIELSEHLRMSQGTLSRWVSIGRSDFILNNRPDMPSTFTGLYQITRLEKMYLDGYGEDRAYQKLSKLISKRHITNTAEISHIQHLIKQLEDLQKSNRKQHKETTILNLSGSVIPSNDRHVSLDKLIQNNQTFRTFFVSPNPDVIKKYKDDSIFDTDINSDFPLSEIRTPTLTDSVMCFIKLPMKDIETGLKMLSGWGFTYRDMLVPSYFKNGLTLLRNENVLIRGERGYSSFKTISGQTEVVNQDDEEILIYLMSVSSSPYISVFLDTHNENWTVCLD